MQQRHADQLIQVREMEAERDGWAAKSKALEEEVDGLKAALKETKQALADCKQRFEKKEQHRAEKLQKNQEMLRAQRKQLHEYLEDISGYTVKLLNSENEKKALEQKLGKLKE